MKKVLELDPTIRENWPYLQIHQEQKRIGGIRQTRTPMCVHEETVRRCSALCGGAKFPSNSDNDRVRILPQYRLIIDRQSLVVFNGCDECHFRPEK